jgi:hypothetical protein
MNKVDNGMIDCYICGRESRFYFRKRFEEFDLGDVDYYECPDCGFVFSGTHHLMNPATWAAVNVAFHSEAEALDVAAMTERPIYLRQNQPPYLQQAMMLNVLSRNGLIGLDDCLDWGSGHGTLSKVLAKYFGVEIMNYDAYMPPQRNYLAKSMLDGRKFDTVINSAVFEHVTHRRYLDEINSYVGDGGCLIFHTVVCETVPRDPDWFYLLPVHCAFHTNKSMEILMRQWGYSCSVYCPAAKMWVLYKDKPERLEASVNAVNAEFQQKYLYAKAGFMDYWK